MASILYRPQYDKDTIAWVINCSVAAVIVREERSSSITQISVASS